MAPEDLKSEQEFLEAQAKAIREHIIRKQAARILVGVTQQVVSTLKLIPRD